jgi:hypothetical protein
MESERPGTLTGAPALYSRGPGSNLRPKILAKALLFLKIKNNAIYHGSFFSFTYPFMIHNSHVI